MEPTYPLLSIGGGQMERSPSGGERAEDWIIQTYGIIALKFNNVFIRDSI